MEDRKKERRACRRELLWYSRIAGRHGTGNTAVCKRPASSFPSFLVSRSFSSRYKENGSSRNDLAVRCFLSRLNATLFPSLSLSIYIYLSYFSAPSRRSFLFLSFSLLPQIQRGDMPLALRYRSYLTDTSLSATSGFQVGSLNVRRIIALARPLL